MALTLYHNPRCSKSREALALLRERGLEPEIVEYLKHPPSPEQLREILQKLGLTADELLRNSEPEARSLGLTGPSAPHADILIEAMCTHPRLIQRPILIHGERARLGRPPEAILEIVH
jgi:arsenate reductase